MLSKEVACGEDETGLAGGGVGLAGGSLFWKSCCDTAMNSLVKAPGSFFAGSGIQGSAAGVDFSPERPMNSLVNDPGDGSTGTGVTFGGAGGGPGLWPPRGEAPSNSPNIASVASLGFETGGATGGRLLGTGSKVLASRKSRVNSPADCDAAGAGTSSENAAVTPPISSEIVSTGCFDGPLFARSARNSVALNSAVSSPAGPLTCFAPCIPVPVGDTPGLAKDW